MSLADEATPERRDVVVTKLRRLVGGKCLDCSTAHTAREAVASVALGFAASPRCLACLARGLR